MSTNTDEPKYIVVIGASAGGLNALSELVAQLNNQMDIAVFIVLHLSTTGIGDYLVQRLQQFTSLKCKKASGNEKIQTGFIYIAQPNYHLLVKKDVVMLGHGTYENRWRPSIDVLFRSVAVAYSTRAIGIILTGLLDDGRAGMNAIKKCGGLAIVQDPNEAEYPDMPLAVLDNMQVDYCVSLSQMGEIISNVVAPSPPPEIEIPEQIQAEANIAENVSVGVDIVENLGDHTIYSCPDCGGGLWEIKDGKTSRYRCYIGHSYSEADLSLKQTENIEATLWVALRMMEERRNLLTKLAEDNVKKGFARLSADHRQRADELETHIERIKEILFVTQNNASSDKTEELSKVRMQA